MTLISSLFHIAATPRLMAMESILQRISKCFSKEYRLLIFGAVALLGATPFSISVHSKALKFRLLDWTSYFPKRLWLSTVLPSAAAINQRMHSVVLYIRGILKRSPYDTYRSSADEARYWKDAERGQRELQRSDARFAGTKVRTPHTPAPQLPPLVMYYTPALLPEYRDTHSQQARSKKRRELRKYYLSTKAYCKWHHMVFPGADHPDVCEASKLRTQHSAEELREIHRISRMLPDDAVFPHLESHEPKLSAKYQAIWKKWLASKPPSISNV